MNEHVQDRSDARRGKKSTEQVDMPVHAFPFRFLIASAEKAGAEGKMLKQKTGRWVRRRGCEIRPTVALSHRNICCYLDKRALSFSVTLRLLSTVAVLQASPFVVVVEFAFCLKYLFLENEARGSTRSENR